MMVERSIGVKVEVKCRQSRAEQSSGQDGAFQETLLQEHGRFCSRSRNGEDSQRCLADPEKCTRSAGDTLDGPRQDFAFTVW